MDTEFVEPAPYVQAFVGELINAGGMLVSIVDNVAKLLVTDGMTLDEANAEAIVMLMGSVAVALTSVPEDDFTRAAGLMNQAADAVLADLRRAERRARQRQRGRPARARPGRPTRR